MSWLEQKYIGLISSRLQKFKKTDDAVWNFRCVYCGDSKDSSKARGYMFLGRKGKVTYYCHNCNISTSFSKFLQFLDAQLHKDYLRDTFAERGVVKTAEDLEKKQNQQQADVNKFRTPVDIGRFHKAKFIKYSMLNDPMVKKVSSLPASHFCKEYITSRKIPNKYHAKLFFVEKFRAWTNKQVPDKFKDVSIDEPRLVIPYVDETGNLFGYQGRAFTGDKKYKYICIMLTPEHPHVYGLDTLDTSKRVYITEGPFDSMFIDNALAMGGSSMDPRIQAHGVLPSNTTVIYDNERRNKQIIERMEEVVDMGFSICIWPDDIKHKDINDMICLGGKTCTDIREIIDNNSYVGQLAKFKITQWKRT